MVLLAKQEYVLYLLILNFDYVEKLIYRLLSYQLLLFATPAEYEKVRAHYEEAAKAFKKKVRHDAFLKHFGWLHIRSLKPAS